MLKNQKGMTFLGFIIITVIALCILLAGVKIVPAYIEFLSVKKVILTIGEKSEFDTMTNNEIMESFDKSASTNYIDVINGRDLIITKDASGKKVVSVDYEVIKPLAFNLSALMDFKTSTAE
jgi:hypothetical protein